MADRVTMADCLAAGYCALGVRRAVRAAGFDMRELMRSGIAIGDWLAVDDHQFKRVAAVAAARGADNE